MGKSLFFAGIFLFVFLAGGCTIVKGTGGAVVGCAQGAAVGGTQGFKDDVNFIKKADNWVKDNLW